MTPQKGMSGLNPKTTSARAVALGGVLAALGVCVMWLGGLLGIATYVAPMLCAMLLQVVKRICGSRLGWAWYGAVAILSMLLVSDREAAGVFVFLGYYPMVKPWLDGRAFPLLWKGILFNGSIFLLYSLLLNVLGLPELTQEFQGLGTVLLILLVVIGNVTFFLLDRVLDKPFWRKLDRYGA